MTSAKAFVSTEEVVKISFKRKYVARIIWRDSMDMKQLAKEGFNSVVEFEVLELVEKLLR